MDDFNYAIASILGAMLLVVGMDAYLFFTEVLSRRWTAMSSNLTRFYFDVDEDSRTGCFENKAFEDVETIEADLFENDLKLQEIPYTRIDF